MENRRKLAITNLCRGFLHVQGFLTDSENEKICQRILNWQNKNEVEITEDNFYLLILLMMITPKKRRNSYGN
ncbi:hypothetical protein B5F97_12065 [Bacteroides clarus]|uniref:Uncharacterized protein n=1 Tax=Bacteroides clarus TaxID=626929 RepID=A0A1Y3YRH6_9BACE|nr:hypothetical protein B5F97_12065 [Bacteroides clarus]